MGTLLSFLFFTVLVGVITYQRTKKENLSSSKGYFLGGKSLNGWVIAGSMLLTNLSAANFTGMTALVYAGNLAPIAWTVTVVVPLIFFGGVLLPIFLRGEFSTVPEFLEFRYGATTQRFVAFLFLLSYILSGMPVALYGGAIAFIQLFNVAALTGLSQTANIWLLVVTLGIIGGIYALVGGLKGVAISDTLNGIGLLFGGVLVFVFGVRAVGHGHFLAGLHTIASAHPEKLNAIGGASDAVPFSVLFTGMLLHNLYYWCTNQFIIQRTLGARSLKEGQKGVLITAFLKVLNVFYIAAPGVIAFHFYGPNHFANNDWAYASLIHDTMPTVFVGFFAAVIFGTVLSHFIGVLNSAVTIFAVDLYKPLWGRDRADAEVIAHAKRLGVVIGAIAVVIAPFIVGFRDGIFQYMVKVEMLFGAPICLILLVGFFFRGVSARAANVTMVIYLVTLGLPLFGVINVPLHYLHVLGILFVAHVGLALLLGRLWPAVARNEVRRTVTDIDTRPWNHFTLVSAIAVGVMVLTYVIFSPLGLA